MSIQSTAARPLATLHPIGADRPDARTLLARAVEAFAEGHAARETPGVGGLTDAHLNEVLGAYLLAQLPQSDQLALARLGGVRERALALGRAGEQKEADGTMKMARFLLSASGFTPMGRAAADTLQQAGESYLSYRRGDFADASARMGQAIDATNRLADAWGESDFSTSRRIHLLHNLMKVEVRRGALREAVTLGTGLLAHLAGVSTGPRLPALDRPLPAMEVQIVRGFSGVVASTIAELLAALPAAEARELIAPLADVGRARGGPATDAWKWIALKSAAHADDPRAFLEGAAPFLRTTRLRVPSLWYAVALDVLRAARALDFTSPGVAEIEAALRTGPRVPASIRVAAEAL